MNELVTVKAPRTAVSVSGTVVIPAAIADAGEHAVRRLEAFASGDGRLVNVGRKKDVDLELELVIAQDRCLTGWRRFSAG